MLSLLSCAGILVASYFYHFLAMHIIRPVQIKAKRCSSFKKAALEWLVLIIGVVFIVGPFLLYTVYVTGIDWGLSEDLTEWIQVALGIAYGVSLLPAFIDNHRKVNSRKYFW